MSERTKRWLRQLGPGLITGAADDDPSGIATYSQAGAQFGYQLGWTLALTYPLMVGIQMVSARMGRVTGQGLAANIRRRFPRPVLYLVVAMLVVANTLNIAADIAAMGEALRLVVGGKMLAWAILFGVLCLGLQVFLSYRVYIRYLKWLTLALLAYVAVVFTIAVPWREVALGLLWPRLVLDCECADRDRRRVRARRSAPTCSSGRRRRKSRNSMPIRRPRRSSSTPPARAGTCAGSRSTPTSAWGSPTSSRCSSLISCAATLHRNGITDIATSAQAAEALRPLAGDAVFLLFGLGIIGTGLLAVPVLAGSAAYAVAESFEWKSGLDLKLLEAREFYGIIAFATLGGVAARLHADRPDQGALLVRSDQRHHRRADHDRDDAAGRRSEGDGRIHRDAPAENAGMAGNVDDGRSRRRDVRSRGLAALGIAGQRSGGGASLGPIFSSASR